MSPAENVRIERVKLKDLNAVASRFIDGAAPGTFIPITKHRAKALQHNPLADPDDVAMLLATEDGRCVGYFGVMAVMLQHQGKLHKVQWLTTWAVAPDFMGKGLGSRLMEEALALDVDLAIVGSKPARRVSAKYGFHEVTPLEYVQIDLGLAGRFNPVSLLLRFLRKLLFFVGIRLRIERLSRRFQRIFEFIFGPIIRPFLLSLLNGRIDRALTELNLKRASPGVVSPDPESPEASRTGFYRDSGVVNWMISYPWVLWQSESEHLNYVFSDTRQIETFGWQLVDSRGANRGYIAFQHSWLHGHRVSKVLDYDLVDNNPRLLLALALRSAAYYKASLIEGPAELAQPLEGTALGRLLTIRRKRTLQVHPRSADSPLGRAWREIQQSYVDGDTAFT